jgi:hypothetical protein
MLLKKHKYSTEESNLCLGASLASGSHQPFSWQRQSNHLKNHYHSVRAITEAPNFIAALTRAAKSP